MRRLFVVASLALLIPAGMAQTAAQHKPQPLNDAAMDRVTAGGMTAGLSDGIVKFQGSVPTKNGLVTLSGGAQQNLTSLVNINAVNSNVNVLLNLNVNINSTVGTITQTNLTGKH
jgi:hypothetical protein